MVSNHDNEMVDIDYFDLFSFSDPDDSLAPPSQDPDISLSQKIEAIKSILENNEKRKTISVFDSKEHFKFLYMGLGLAIDPSHVVIDPKIALWMLQPSDKERNLNNIVMNLNQDLVGLLDTLGNARGCGSVALNPKSNKSGRSRALAEAIIVKGVMNTLEQKMKEVSMWKTFIGII